MNWLRNFYFLRAAVAAVWIAAVLLTAPAPPGLSCALFALYPAWDAVANWLDAQRSGGLRRNRGQAYNVVVSAATALVMVAAVTLHGNAGGVLVFGGWALLAGIFQLAVGIARRKLGGQALMMVSGAQSALAGLAFIFQSLHAAPSLVRLTGYAGFGAFYFLASAAWLAFKKPAPAAAVS
jgi:hypothetical protein